jgi:(p)ppGpp synthase/HD superfamily hydrolase
MIKPLYNKSQIDVAGKILAHWDDPSITGGQMIEAIDVINNWRASHSFPLNTLQCGLRLKSTEIERDSVVAQRIKRLSSIQSKLMRFPTMNLSRMQDIGGCRAIVSSITNVDKLVELHKESRMKHKHGKSSDYIRTPKTSGYRGFHLVYRYFSDKNDTYNGLNIEVQVRTVLQHAWATAVETAGTFIRQPLKSSIGESDC